MNKTFDIALVGATDSFAEAVCSLLEEREFPVGKLFPLDTQEWVGDTIMFKGRPQMIGNVDEFDFSQVNLAFFTGDRNLSSQFCENAASAGCVGIDCSGVFAQDETVPFVVATINPEVLAGFADRRIIASPGPISIQLLLAVKPIFDAVGVTRIEVATYQSVSCAGKKAVEELARQTARLLSGQTIEKNVFLHQMAFNIVPQVDEFNENDYTLAELNLAKESGRILADEGLTVNATCVQVPVFYGDCAALHISTKTKLTADAARKLIKKSPGLKLVDKPEKSTYPTPVKSADDSGFVFVGRIREDLSHPLGLNLWITSDNVRKGAALNSVQIAELLIKDYI